MKTMHLNKLYDVFSTTATTITKTTKTVNPTLLHTERIHEALPFCCNTIHELKDRMKKEMHLWKLCDQFYNQCHLNFQIFTPEVLY
jgi:hypothetical protein